MPRRWVIVASINGLLAVALGAFGAHSLKHIIDESALATYEVGVRYQMYHALALLGVACFMSIQPTKMVKASAWCMLIGILFFSGSLYGLSLAGWRWLGPVTPLGGFFFILGWLCLAIGAGRRKL